MNEVFRNSPQVHLLAVLCRTHPLLRVEGGIPKRIGFFWTFQGYEWCFCSRRISKGWGLRPISSALTDYQSRSDSNGDEGRLILFKESLCSNYLGGSLGLRFGVYIGLGLKPPSICCILQAFVCEL
jgi:hypothetical protein